MACNDMQLAVLILICHSSHHITSTASTAYPFIPILPEPSSTSHHRQSHITIVVAFACSRGKIWKNPTGPRCALSPVLPLTACLLPDHYSISPKARARSKESKKRKATKTSLAGPGCHPDVAFPWGPMEEYGEWRLRGAAHG